MASSRKKAKSTLPVLVVLATSALLLIIAVLTNNRPNQKSLDLSEYFASENGSLPVIRDYVLTHEDFLVEGDTVYTSVSYLQEQLNKRFFYDETEKLLLYTKPEGTAQADLASRYADKPVLLERSGTVYVLLEYVKQFTAMEWQLCREPDRLILKTVFGEEGRLTTLGRATLRSGPSLSSPVLVQLDQGVELHYLEEQAEWNRVCTMDGIPAYVSKSEVSHPSIITSVSPLEEAVYPLNQMEGNVGLIWHLVGYPSDNDKLEELTASMQGINVISPTWLFLNGSEGKLVSLADASYVERAHGLGLKVWVLLNNMNYDIYGDDLRGNFDVTSHRRQLIQTIMEEVKACGADGINVDIESLPAAGGRGFLQFIRELSLATHEAGLILSVDNYVPSAWTQYYNRAEQAVFADYLVVMAYDEHYAGSDAGSTASLPFVIQGVEDTLEQVPAHKVIAALPFYTRVWRGNGENLSSMTLRMGEVAAYLEKYQLEPSWDSNLGQYYVEFTLDGDPARIWLEEVESMSLRVESLQGYGLAGIGAWRLGMENPEVWPVFEQFMKSNQPQ